MELLCINKITEFMSRKRTVGVVNRQFYLLLGMDFTPVEHICVSANWWAPQITWTLLKFIMVSAGRAHCEASEVSAPMDTSNQMQIIQFSYNIILVYLHNWYLTFCSMFYLKCKLKMFVVLENELILRTSLIHLLYMSLIPRCFIPFATSICTCHVLLFMISCFIDYMF